MFGGLIIFLLIFLVSWNQSYAQTKIRYIDSQRILSEFPEAQEITTYNEAVRPIHI